MKDFIYYAPTEVVFGQESEEKVALLTKNYGGTKVLVHYGGQSAVRSGLLDKVCGLLKEGGIEYVTLGGVVPNQSVSPMEYVTTATYGTFMLERQSLLLCFP